MRDAAVSTFDAVPSGVERSVRIGALSWKDFAADVDACTACGLCKTRRRSVPGVGDTRAEWMFVGEAPGAEEDARGEPFVGQAGRLLDSMLLALGMRRDRNVYIANVLKCRPPDNRTPTPAETQACRAYLDRQIELIAAEADHRAGQERGEHAARRRREHRQHARSRAPLRKRAADRDLSSCVPAAQLARQGESVGRFMSCPGHDAQPAGRSR